MNELVKELIASGTLVTPRIINTFKAIDRKDFVRPEHELQAYQNYPLPIGEGQTISQPEVVAFMLERLEPHEGERILEVGAGSGWQTAMLAHIAGLSGRVYAFEVIPALKAFGESNVAKYNFIQKGIVEFFAKSAQDGLPERAPFDRIIAAASAQEIPPAWKEQLAVGGKMVLPVKDSIWLIEKKGENKFEEKEYPGFVFVPFVKK